MKEIYDDILKNDTGIIVQGVNCSGAMGSGLAGQIKKRYPIVYKVFMNTPPCPELMGEIQAIRVGDGFFIVNAFTQVTYGRTGKHAKIHAIQDSLYRVLSFADRNDIPIIRAPRLGCGLGGLDWKTVKPFFETFSLACADRDIEFEVWNYD